MKFLLIFTVALLAGCASTPPVPYTGDLCEYQKAVFVRATQQYEKIVDAWYSLPLDIYPYQQKVAEARANMSAACNDSEKKKSGVWACAEGHSCKDQ